MKKKINIVLLLLVLCLWGTVIYRYVSQYFLKTDISITAHQKKIFIENKILTKDTFDMQNSHRDPFLNKSIAVRNFFSGSRRSAKITVKEKPKVISTKSFPRIQYYGYIKSDGKSAETFLLNIDGSFFKLNLHQDKQGLKIVALKKDSIKVSYNKEVKWFGLRKK
jgi:hypothetical protein